MGRGRPGWPLDRQVTPRVVELLDLNLEAPSSAMQANFDGRDRAAESVCGFAAGKIIPVDELQELCVTVLEAIQRQTDYIPNGSYLQGFVDLAARALLDSGQPTAECFLPGSRPPQIRQRSPGHSEQPGSGRVGQFLSPAPRHQERLRCSILRKVQTGSHDSIRQYGVVLLVENPLKPLQLMPVSWAEDRIVIHAVASTPPACCHNDEVAAMGRKVTPPERRPSSATRHRKACTPAHSPSQYSRRPSESSPESTRKRRSLQAYRNAPIDVPDQASAQPNDKPGVSPPGVHPGPLGRLAPLPIAEAGELQGRADESESDIHGPSAIKAREGGRHWTSFQSCRQSRSSVRRRASRPLLSGSLTEVTVPWIPMRGAHERGRQRTNRRGPPTTRRQRPTPPMPERST